MTMPKAYIVSVLITTCTLLAAGYSQTGNARTAPEAANSQDSTPQPFNSGKRTVSGTSPNSPNSSDHPASAKTAQLGGGGQRQSGKAPGSSFGVPATPVNPPAVVLDSPVVAASPESGAAVPQSALFEFLFDNIAALDQVADNDDKAGDHTSAALWRTHDQRTAGLNDAEGEILQEIALDCLRLLKQEDAKFQAAAERFRAQLKPGGTVQIPPDLTQMFQDRKQIVSNHIERLREALGEASFNKLDAYVHSSFHAEVILPKPAAHPIPMTEKRPKENK